MTDDSRAVKTKHLLPVHKGLSGLTNVIVAQCYCVNLHMTDDSRSVMTILLLPVQMSSVGSGHLSDIFSSSSLTLPHLFLILLLEPSNRSL